MLDYVIHVKDGAAGPHAIEVNLSQLKLYWPFLADLKLVMGVVAIFSHFCCIDWAHCNPPSEAGARWMFVNVILRHGELLVVSPSPLPLAADGPRPPGTWLPAVLLQWDTLRIGYDWGGSSETVLLANLDALSASLVTSVDLSLVNRQWNHRHGMAVEKPPLLLPLSGQIRWQASKPPGHARPLSEAHSGQESLWGGASMHSAVSRISNGTIKTLGWCDPVDEGDLTTTHDHSIAVDLQEVRLQPVLSLRLHLQSVVHALASGDAAAEAPPRAPEGKQRAAAPPSAAAGTPALLLSTAGDTSRLVARKHSGSERGAARSDRSAVPKLGSRSRSASLSRSSRQAEGSTAARSRRPQLSKEEHESSLASSRKPGPNLLETVGNTALEMRRRAASFTDRVISRTFNEKGGQRIKPSRRLLLPAAHPSFSSLGPTFEQVYSSPTKCACLFYYRCACVIYRHG